MENKQYGLDITDKRDLVGICYTMWFNAVLGSGDTPVTHANNVTELTEQYGWSDEYGFGNAQEQHNDLYAFHYWAEPAQGYYRSSDKADFAVFNEVYAAYFTTNPARSCVAVKTLPKGVLVEVEVVALAE